MINSYKKFWDNIFNFSSTSSRSDYWWPVIINYILGGLLIGIIQKLMGHSIEDIYTISDLTTNTLVRLVTIIVWIGTLSVKVRRLHDTDRSGWWILIDLIPLIGTIWFFILMILPSKRSRWN
ncbi:DUF805 domain-containing protein [Companilactobacillus nuruki]|uniref:DUF805 domain-containing protein n=1 Tax=Companilactobacillus nuruki TaxID=1993540 RepID=A0A2N7AS93_9LACO|nr:DUF805 domain-containing protein [Companilactobacillus nuruki]PMD68221.1 DUF805 domain-containing protein [Companilactobacillus nuruki]